MVAGAGHLACVMLALPGPFWLRMPEAEAVHGWLGKRDAQEGVDELTCDQFLRDAAYQTFAGGNKRPVSCAHHLIEGRLLRSTAPVAMPARSVMLGALGSIRERMLVLLVLWQGACKRVLLLSFRRKFSRIGRLWPACLHELSGAERQEYGQHKREGATGAPVLAPSWLDSGAHGRPRWLGRLRFDVWPLLVCWCGFGWR